jgi:transcription initiation factor TFIID subunit 8
VEVLSDILIRFITEIGQSAHSYAEVAGRSEFNIVDVLLSLDDLGQPLDELQTYARSLVRAAPWG